MKYWLMVYLIANGGWAHTFSTYQDRNDCLSAGQEATANSQLYFTCVPFPKTPEKTPEGPVPYAPDHQH